MADICVPSILYGTAWKEDRTAEFTELALRKGFHGVDTANQRRHYFEAAVGEGVAAAYRAGVVSRTGLFLQTKFTYQRGQDARLPYDPAAPLCSQVQQSLHSSLQHLGAEYVDSYLLHGPSSGYEWSDEDAEVWAAMVCERDAGRTRLLGVSNVSLNHLQQMAASGVEMPSLVQNRCFARTGWDREIRQFCAQHDIRYQGFSLLTANMEVLQHPLLRQIAQLADATVAQVIFSFSLAIGMLPLTGTSSAEHMEQDIAAAELKLPQEAIDAIENLAG